MSKDVTAEFITFDTILPRGVRVIKKADKPLLDRDDYVRQHEIALLKLLVPKYPEVVTEMSAKYNLQPCVK